MSTSVSVLIALGSGLSSGLLTAAVTTRNDRRERFRHRLIEAADEFASAAAEALIKTRDAIGDVRVRNDAERMKAATELAWDQRDAVLRRSARVDLLFGPDRDASRKANQVVNQLASVVAALTPPSLDAGVAARAHLQAVEALRGFSVAAADAIQQAEPPVVTQVERERHNLSRRRRTSGWR